MTEKVAMSDTTKKVKQYELFRFCDIKNGQSFIRIPDDFCVKVEPVKIDNVSVHANAFYPKLNASSKWLYFLDNVIVSVEIISDDGK